MINMDNFINRLSVLWWRKYAVLHSPHPHQKDSNQPSIRLTVLGEHKNIFAGPVTDLCHTGNSTHRDRVRKNLK